LAKPRPPILHIYAGPNGAFGRRSDVPLRPSIQKESYHEPTFCCARLDRGAFDSGPCHAGGTSRRSSSGPAPFRTEAEPGPGEPDQRSILAALPLLIVHGQQLRVRLLAKGRRHRPAPDAPSDK